MIMTKNTVGDTAASGPASLVLTGVSKKFETTGGRRHALETETFAVSDVTLTVEPGEFITLLGPSGCGKTTTLRMIAGFETPTAGRIDIAGRNMVGVPPNERPISMVFQSYALFPHLSVWENVAFGLRLKRLRRAEIEERVELALATMNLMNQGRKSPSQLSGGQQQRVALARAMVMRPSVMLFDEPLSNLDAKLRVQMRAEIRHLQQRMRTTTVFVTHDQAEAMTMSDRIVVMQSGRIAQVGTPAEVYQRPASLFVGDFIGRANFIDVPVLAVENGVAAVSIFGTTHRVAAHPRVRPGTRASLLVRPESLTVRPELPTDESASRGRITTTTYYGNSVEYELDSPQGHLIGTAPGPQAGGLRLGEGMRATVDFDESDAWLLPDEPFESAADLAEEPLDTLSLATP
jgi:iron(III) transport system ATP-binding protein